MNSPRNTDSGNTKGKRSPRYQIKARAKRELENAVGYLETLRPSAAERLALRLQEACELLAQMPLLGRVPRTARTLRKNYRCFVMDDYLIYYKVTGYGVAIYRIIHVRLEGDLPPRKPPHPPILP